MGVDLLHERGRGPEIRGTRITVFNLLPHFLDESATEAHICGLYDLTPEQVAAARAYVLNNADSVLAEHLRIEARIATGNPPEIIVRAAQTRATFESFRDWLAQQRPGTGKEENRNGDRRLASYMEWLAEEQSRSEVKS
jgi:uncharacterized protein (DUF433 family)